MSLFGLAEIVERERADRAKVRAILRRTGGQRAVHEYDLRLVLQPRTMWGEIFERLVRAKPEKETNAPT